MTSYSSRDLFSELESGQQGKSFSNYGCLQQAVLDKFNEHLADFPPRYSYLQLIEWGERQGWISSESSGYRIHVQESGVSIG